jgi:hypothetical protein
MVSLCRGLEGIDFHTRYAPPPPLTFLGYSQIQYFYGTVAYEICFKGLYFYGIYIYGIYFYRALKFLNIASNVKKYIKIQGKM